MDDLEELQLNAAALDADIAAEHAAPDPAVQQQAGEMLAAQQIAQGNAAHQNKIRQVIGLVVMAAGKQQPRIMEFYTPDAVNEIAASVVKLCDAYGIDLTAWLGKGGGKLDAWMGLLVAAGLPLLGYMAAVSTPPEKTVETAPAMEG